MDADRTSRHVPIMVTSLALASLILLFHIRGSNSTVTTFAFSQGCIFFLCAYIFSRARILSPEGPPQHAEYKNYTIEWSLCLTLILIPPGLAFLSDLLIYTSGSSGTNFDGLIFLLMSILGAVSLISLIYCSTSISTTTRNSLTEYLGIPLAVGSLFIWLGDSSAFGYLSLAIPASAFSLNLAARIVVTTILGLFVLIDVIRHLFAHGWRLSDVLDRYTKAFAANLKFHNESQSSEVWRVFEVITFVVSVIFGAILLILETVFWLLYTLIEGVVWALIGLLNPQRLFISVVLCIVVVAALLGQNDATNLGSLTGQSLNGFEADIAFLVFGLRFFVYIGVITLGYTWLCYRRLGDVVSTYPFVVALTVGGIWLCSLFLHVANALGIADAPGYSLSTMTPFYVGGLALTVVGGIVTFVRGGARGLGGNASTSDGDGSGDYDSITPGSLWSAVSGRHVLAVLIYLLLLVITLYLSGAREIAEPSDSDQIVRSGDRVEPAEGATVVSTGEQYAWIYGRWGIGGDCSSNSSIVDISGDRGFLEVSFGNRPDRQRIISWSSQFVFTEEWRFTRREGALAAENNGNPIGELRPCSR